VKISILVFAFVLGLNACTTAKKEGPTKTEISATKPDIRQALPHPSWQADFPTTVVGGKNIIIWMYANKISSVDITSPDELDYEHSLRDMTNGLQKIIVKTKTVQQQAALQIKVKADGRSGTYLIQLLNEEA